MEPGRETAVIFAELLGASELLGRADDAQAHAAVGEALASLEQVTVASGARVVKRIGARLLVVTTDPDEAARTAVALQVAAHNLTGEHNFGLGVGFHFGPVIQDESDVFGDTVNTAARLSKAAGAGEVLVSDETATAGALDTEGLEHRVLELRGREQTVGAWVRPLVVPA